VSFSVAQGEIFGVLGPNGAGKTTAVECLSGLRSPDSGRIEIMGLSPATDSQALHVIVGVQLQTSAIQEKLKIGEILDLYQSFYEKPASVKALAKGLGLEEKLNAYYKTLSGGQKQRLSVALALIGKPKVALLDEMTTGLDPQARRNCWELIEHVRDQGTTIILVTHFMEEAERLCDRVALIDNGRIIASDSPHALAEKVAGGKRISFIPSKLFEDSLLTRLHEVKTLEHHAKRVEVVGSGELVNVIILTLAKADIDALDVQMETANLEDAFVKLTGRHIHEDGEAKTK
jgi:ABC-2 type transport system ATP-binding protein